MELGGVVREETVLWFEREESAELNSNAYTIAGELIEKHFPGILPRSERR